MGCGVRFSIFCAAAVGAMAAAAAGEGARVAAAVVPFDPTRPDPIDAIVLPLSLGSPPIAKPEGS